MAFNLKRVFLDIKSQIKLITLGVVLSGFLTLAILLSSFYIEMWSLRIVIWIAPHVVALILTLALLMPYLCGDTRCGTGRIIGAIILLLFVALAGLLFFILVIIQLATAGCATVPACNNIKGIFIAVLILKAILIGLELLMVVYLFFSLRTTVTRACKGVCKIGGKVNARNTMLILNERNNSTSGGRDYENQMQTGISKYE